MAIVINIFISTRKTIDMHKTTVMQYALHAIMFLNNMPTSLEYNTIWDKNYLFNND